MEVCIPLMIIWVIRYDNWTMRLCIYPRFNLLCRGLGATDTQNAGANRANNGYIHDALQPGNNGLAMKIRRSAVVGLMVFISMFTLFMLFLTILIYANIYILDFAEQYGRGIDHHMGTTNNRCSTISISKEMGNHS